MLKNPVEGDATQAIRLLTRDEQVVGWGRERKVVVAAWLRLTVGRRSRVGEGMVGAVGRVGVGNGCRVWLRRSDYRGMGEVEGGETTLRGCGRKLEGIAAWKTGAGDYVGGIGAVDGRQAWPLSGK